VRQLREGGHKQGVEKAEAQASVEGEADVMQVGVSARERVYGRCGGGGGGGIACIVYGHSSA